jgi:hypothetical protein
LLRLGTLYCVAEAARPVHDLDGQVRKWLDTEGYPLEYAVARELRRNRFRTFHGLSYVDRSTGRPREIDVVAELQSSDRAIWLTIECKASALPWVVLTEESRPADWGLFIASSSAHWEARIRRQLAIPVNHGFSLVQALKRGDQDLAFVALNQAAGAAAGLLESPHRDRPGLVLPVVVVSSPLYSLFVETSGEEILTRVPWSRLIWSGASIGRTLLDVVTREGLSGYAQTLHEDLTAILAPDDYPY